MSSSPLCNKEVKTGLHMQLHCFLVLTFQGQQDILTYCFQNLKFSVAMNSEETRCLSTPDIPECQHQRQAQSLNDIISELGWKIRELSVTLEEMQYELSFEPEFLGKWDEHDELSEERRLAELELKTCNDLLEKETKNAELQDCYCLLN